MTDATRYVPILKGKAGELDGLRDVQLRTRQEMRPLVEVVPPDDLDDMASTEKACRQTTTKLQARYVDPVMLDAGLFDLSIMHAGQTALGMLLDAAADAGLRAQPVIRVGDPAGAVRDAGAAHSRYQRGITVRLVGEDLDEDPDDLDPALDAILAGANVPRNEVDLVLDLGAVDSEVAVRGGARLVTSLMRDLPSITDWRSVTVASGAFPVDLSQFSPNVIGERPRLDAQLFDLVRGRRLPRQPDYGDYAIAHPLLTTGVPFSPPPQLRYTTADHWLVLKGRRNDPRANAQFHDICTRIAAHPEFAGIPLGQADARIAAGSPQGPGNGTTWRMLGTTHHLDLVAMRLTTLGEP